MAFTAADRILLKRCLRHEPGAWREFVDRFLGLIYHVIQSTSHLRSQPMQPEDVEDLAAEIMAQIIARDYAVLRQFKGQSSLAGYLTVIARRICVHELTGRGGAREVQAADHRLLDQADHLAKAPGEGGDAEDEVQQLLRKLPAGEREVVRLFYLEARSYEEISTELNIPINSIGPILSRARKRMRDDPRSSSQVPTDL